MPALDEAQAVVTRFWSRVDRRGPAECWLWTGGSSRSGRREVNYGAIWEGAPSSKVWRANRIALLLKTAPVDCPRDADEPLVEWLRRANRVYDHLEASHSCDVSLCCNPEHLEWKTHTENLADQKLRQRASELASTAPSGTSIPASIGSAALLPDGCVEALTV